MTPLQTRLAELEKIEKLTLPAPVEAHQEILRKKYEAFVAKLRTTPPEGLECDFEVGDAVIYTNDYGVEFDDFFVIGFAEDDSFQGRWIHAAKAGDRVYNGCAYWFPKSPGELRMKPEEPETGCIEETINQPELGEAKVIHTIEVVQRLYSEIGVPAVGETFVFIGDENRRLLSNPAKSIDVAADEKFIEQVKKVAEDGGNELTEDEIEQFSSDCLYEDGEISVVRTGAKII